MADKPRLYRKDVTRNFVETGSEEEAWYELTCSHCGGRLGNDWHSTVTFPSIPHYEGCPVVPLVAAEYAGVWDGYTGPPIWQRRAGG